MEEPTGSELETVPRDSLTAPARWGASSRTTGTTKTWLVGWRRTVVARKVMVGSGLLLAALAEAAARGALCLVCVGVHEVDQRGVHDNGHFPPLEVLFRGGWQACARCAPGQRG